MSSSRYRTPSPSPGPKPFLDLQATPLTTTPAPAPSQSSRLSRTPRTPKKSKPYGDFVYCGDDSDDDPLAYLDEDEEDDFELPSSPSKKAKSSSGSAVVKQPKGKGKKQQNTDEWDDIPDWGEEKHCYLWDLPAELLDKILASPTLTLRDHLSLAASCRTLRAPYYTFSAASSPRTLTGPLWEALMVLRPPANHGNSTRSDTKPTRKHRKLIARIFSNEDKCEVSKMNVLWPATSGKSNDKTSASAKKGKKREREEDVVVRRKAMISQQWQEAIDMIEDSKITKTDAMKEYKISEKHLAPLPHITKRNPHDRHGDTVMRLYVEAAVEAKALKLHGGPIGHKELLKKRAETAKKAAATRAKNGTTQRRGSKNYYQAPRIGGYYYGYRGYDKGYW